MPRISGYFNRYEQLIVGASDYDRMVLSDTYHDFIQWNLANFESDSTLKFDKYGDPVARAADNVFQMLRHHGRYGPDTPWSSFLDDRGPMALYVQLKNEEFLRRYVRNQPFYDNYEGIDPSIIEELKPSLPYLSAAMDLALSFCQDVTRQHFYDVKQWSRGYEGPMAFLGATTPINPQSSSKGFYDFLGETGSDLIRPGDIVTNCMPLGLYASPNKPAERCLHNALAYLSSTVADWADVGKDIFARNIFFEIDLLEARNIATINESGGKELMIRTGRKFSVMDIDEAIAFGKPMGLIVSLQEIPQDPPGTTTDYRDLIDCAPFHYVVPNV